MLPKIHDREGHIRTRQWLYGHYGFVHIHPPAAKPPNGPRYRLEALHETRGPILPITVLAPNAQPIARVRVMLCWPDAPEAPGTGWLQQAAAARTGRDGLAHHRLGDGAQYQPPTIGPHSLWIHGPNCSPMISGIGMVNGYLLAPTFRMLGTGELPNPEPIDQALSFLRSASKHMGTALDDVSAAIDRLQSLPSPEPPDVPHGEHDRPAWGSRS
jgi:hypothetical protein